MEVLFTPTEYSALQDRDLQGTTCVVFDILRATSTMVTALAQGAESIIPVAEIAEAVALRRAHPEILLAGERRGLRIGAELTGDVDFDLGNSPREFTRERVAGKSIAMTTTNGTRALRACARAGTLLIAAFVNLSSTADFILKQRPERLMLVCAGLGEEVSYEDILGAGALCDLLQGDFSADGMRDSFLTALKLFRLEADDVAGAFAQSRNGQRLLSLPELREDVIFCARRDIFPLVARMDRHGVIRRLCLKECKQRRCR